MEFISVALDDGRIEPQFASHPSLDIRSCERPDAFRHLLTERLFREVEKEPRFRRFINHAWGTGPHPHKREVSAMHGLTSISAGHRGNRPSPYRRAEGTLLK